MFHRILNNFTNEQLITGYTFVFYCSLWLINPNRKYILLSYILLFFCYQILIKNSYSSLWLTWLASTIVFSGKEFRFELIPPGVYPQEIFPLGVQQIVMISPKIIVSIIMGITLIRHFMKSRTIPRIQTIDWLIALFLGMKVFTDLIWSNNPMPSLTLSLLNIGTLCVYFFTKFTIQDLKLSHIKSVVVSLILFETLVIGQQISTKGIEYKNLSSQTNVEVFGNTADERNLPFRPIGTFEHANSLGLWLSFYLLLITGAKVKVQPLKSILVMTTLSLLIATISRSAWIGFLCGFLFLFGIHIKKFNSNPLSHLFSKGILIICALLPLLIIYVLPRFERSLYTFIEGGGVLRSEQAKETLKLIQSHLFVGVGTGQSVVVAQKNFPDGVFGNVGLPVHNAYLLNAIENGIPNLIIWIVIMLMAIKNNLRAIMSSKKLSDITSLKISWIAGAFCLSIIGLFQPSFDHDTIITSLGVIYALEKN